MTGQRARRAPDGLAWLRILATSDVHAHLRAHDYTRDEDADHWGLTRTATLINAARQEAQHSILLDNGDFLQGSPVADLYSGSAKSTGKHPVLLAMDALGYDAIGLGNHEFNYGLDRLDAMLSETALPVMCSNMVMPGKNGTTRFPATRLIERHVEHPKTGRSEALRIGLISLLPNQVMQWDGAHLRNRVQVQNMVETARHLVPKLRDDGADLVVVLAHTGIDPQDQTDEAENAAMALAQVPGIDAMITGHTHRVFPGSQGATTDDIDEGRGTINGIPVVMPGYRGSHLGVIDLFLEHTGEGWRVKDHHSAAESVAGCREDQKLADVIEGGHRATLAYINQPLGHAARPVHSYLSLIRCDRPIRILAAAQRVAMQKALAGGPYADLPLLSAAAPYQTGGRSGPLAYTDIPQGPLTMRSVSSLYPFPNMLCAVKASGAQVREWLERSASCFQQITPGLGTQPLLNPEFPGHAIDTLDGLTYHIDLTAPPGFDHTGRRLTADSVAPRILDLAHNGKPVADTDNFIVALNGYRAFGGGPYEPVAPERFVVDPSVCARKALAEYLADAGTDQVSDEPCWRFLPVPGACGLFETGPGLLAHHDEMAHLGLQDRGTTAEGFLTICLPLDATTCESAA